MIGGDCHRRRSVINQRGIGVFIALVRRLHLLKNALWRQWRNLPGVSIARTLGGDLLARRSCSNLATLAMKRSLRRRQRRFGHLRARAHVHFNSVDQRLGRTRGHSRRRRPDVKHRVRRNQRNHPALSHRVFRSRKHCVQPPIHPHEHVSESRHRIHLRKGHRQPQTRFGVAKTGRKHVHIRHGLIHRLRHDRRRPLPDREVRPQRDRHQNRKCRPPQNHRGIVPRFGHRQNEIIQNRGGNDISQGERPDLRQFI